MIYAGALDAITGAVEHKQVNTMCRAVGTFVNVARNSEPVGELCDRIAQQQTDRAAEQQRQAERDRIAQLEAELAVLKARQTA